MINFLIGLCVGVFITTLKSMGTISDLRHDIMHLQYKLKQADKG